VSAPNPEARALSAPVFHAVGSHSTGLVVTDQDTDDHAFSWAIRRRPAKIGKRAARDFHDELGPVELAELGGWGLAGPVPALDEMNGPPSLLSVHTVMVDGVTPEHYAILRRLVDEHAARFGECRVFVANGASRDLAAWVEAGCPPTGEAPTDEELAAAAELHHGVDRQPTRRGPGWEVSEPIVPEEATA
jgi:hypothetical protein